MLLGTFTLAKKNNSRASASHDSSREVSMGQDISESVSKKMRWREVFREVSKRSLRTPQAGIQYTCAAKPLLLILH